MGRAHVSLRWSRRPRHLRARGGEIARAPPPNPLALALIGHHRPVLLTAAAFLELLPAPAGAGVVPRDLWPAGGYWRGRPAHHSGDVRQLTEGQPFSATAQPQVK